MGTDAADARGVDAPAAPRAHILQSAAEGRGDVARPSQSGPTTLEDVGSPVRGGTKAIRSHLPAPDAYRAEIEMKSVDIGSTTWLGWSVRVEKVGSYAILAQLATYPELPGRRTDVCQEVNGKAQDLYTGGNGHKLSVEADGSVQYILRHKGTAADVGCEIKTLATLAQIRGKWVDFVVHARWTGNSDGFFKMWMRIDGGPWTVAFDHVGATWWNDEDRGPYFKMGAYTGPDKKADAFPVEVITDEHYLGDALATFSDVSADRSAAPGER